MRAPDDPDLTMMIYSAPPGSDAATSLNLLTGLATSPPQTTPSHRTVSVHAP
ncbi:hypothetical protein [Nonomuraea sp. NPDC049607]